MYSTVLVIHSWLRWVALVAGVGAVAMALREATLPRAEKWGLVLMMTLDLQLLLGALLYFALSPFTAQAFNDMSAAMANPQLRFFVVDHPTTMVLAVVVVHVGRIMARKAAAPAAKRTRLLYAFGIALLLMLAGIPWPGLAAGRPLFRI
jgi:hypothetical protein